MTEKLADINVIPIKRNLVIHPSLPSATILRVPFHRLCFDDALHMAVDYIQSKEPHQICLSNAYTVALAQNDEPFMRLMQNADLVLADGMSIVWGARWVGLKLPGRIAGPDFMEALCAIAAQKGYGIFLLGSTHENLLQLSEALLSRYPQLIIRGMYSPPMCEEIDDIENQKIIQKLNDAKPDIMFVGMSAPKQEKWIAAHLQTFHIPLCVGVGAAFDFISGRIPRAPNWMQKSGLEWAYRLFCEPKRLWRRYLLGNLVFLSLLLKECITISFKKNYIK